MDIAKLILDKVNSEFANSIIETSDFRDDLCITVKKEQIISIAKFLKEDPQLQFIMCKDVTAIDWATSKNRFTTVYNIYSFLLNYTLRLKSDIDTDPPEIDSVTSIWHSADWYERETFDMYGIKFIGHPDLRRMYMPEGFEYYPLRKEFPLLGIPGSLPLPDKDER